jgi:hypothetical protein
MKLEIKGKIIKEFEVKTGKGQKGEWKNKEYLITFDDKYPKELILVAWNDMIATMDDLITDREVTFHVEPTSRESNGRYFTSVKVWKVTQPER